MPVEVKNDTLVFSGDDLDNLRVMLYFAADVLDRSGNSVLPGIADRYVEKIYECYGEPCPDERRKHDR